MELPERIRRQRYELHLTQEKLAKWVGVPVRTLKRWESGRGCPDIDSLLVLSTIFGVPVEKLVGKDVERMRREVTNGRKGKLYRMIYAVLFVAMIFSVIPLAIDSRILFLCIALYAAMVGFAFQSEQLRQRNAAYREIIAYMIRKKRESGGKRSVVGRKSGRKKRKQWPQKALLMLVCGLLVASVTAIALWADQMGM